MAKRPNQPSGRERFDKLFAEGNFKDAYDGYRRLALDPKTEADRVGTDLKQAVRCLNSLGRIDEMDAFVEAVVAVHPANWRLLQAAAETYFLANEHWGAIVAGKFHRGERADGRAAGSYERDRARAIQLMIAGLDVARSDPDRAAVGRLLPFPRPGLPGQPRQVDSWRLQSLTAFEVLPDYDANPSVVLCREPLRCTRRARRLSRLLSRAREPPARQERRPALALGTHSGRGSRPQPAQHHAADLWLSSCSTSSARRPSIGHDVPVLIRRRRRRAEATGPYALDTLKDDETIAWLASGIKRFKLPDEFNPIKIYQAIAENPKTGQGELALNSLASIFENRRQFDRAADYLKKSRELYGDKDEQQETPDRPDPGCLGPV